MKKRLLAIILCMIMALSLGACGSSDKTRGSVKDVSSTAEIDEDDDEDDDDVVSTEVVDEDETDVEDSDDSDTEAFYGGDDDDDEVVNTGDDEFVPGTSDSFTYSNSFFNICVTLDGWTLLSDEEILAINQAAAGIFGDDYAELMEKTQTITDMQATNSNGTDSINVTIEKLPIAALAMTELDYIEQSAPLLKSTLEQGGISISEMEIENVYFAGESHASVYLHGDYMGYDIYERLVAIKNNGYVAVIGASSFFTDYTAEYMGYFEELN